MTTAAKPPVFVVLQLSGGNDYMNSVVPYADPHYYDSRKGTLRVGAEDVLKIDDAVGLHPKMAPLKELYDQGDMAIIHGVGYPNSPRSHFRSMDIWHTCEPDKVGTEGWVARAIRDLDPQGENPVTGVNIGLSLPRAMVLPGVSVASVADLSTYGLLTSIEQEQQRTKMLQRFSTMYGRAIGTGPVNAYLGQTGLDALSGAGILKGALGDYASEVEYGTDPIAKALRDVATIHTADVGTRVFYTQHAGFDTHASQAPTFERLWTEVSRAVTDFWDDLRAHDADENVVMFVFSEFGRRVRDNGSGTDHGAGGGCFAFGPSIRGGQYGLYPDTRPEALDQGDLVPNLDFRGVYSTILEDWLGLDPVPIVNGQFEQPRFVETVGSAA